MDRDEALIDEIVSKSKLTVPTVHYLLDQGWTFVTMEGTDEIAYMWVSPTAGGLRDHIQHEEPNCDNSCGRLDPHRHGLPCYSRCVSCEGVCHPDCPAYIEES